ncbi:MAG TPA: protein kinase, partial [Kofleriaceae bacterium]
MLHACPRCTAQSETSRQFCPECGTAFVDGIDGVAATAVLPITAATSLGGSNLVGTTIDNAFIVDSVLGGGAFGTVYKGRQLGLDRPVAIKVPTSAIAADPVMAKRFAREARSAARITHPGVVAIYAVGELADARPYLAMQFVDGQSLDKILADGPLLPVRALAIIRSIGSALAETHAADVVHRDLKPSNIVWRRDRHGDDLITIVDFGIAASKPGATADTTRLTHDGVVGTPSYMSPEQAHGDIVDARSDLYAVGCLLYELVTGAPPFEGNGLEVLMAHMAQVPPAPSTKHAGIPATIDALCAKLLAKKPDDRLQSADALVAAVDAALADARPRRSSKITSAPPPAKSSRRFAIGASIAAALLAVAAGVGAHMIVHGGDQTRDEANDTPNTPVTPSGADRRAFDLDDGELVMHVLVPDPIHAGTLIRPHLEIRNKLGQPVRAAELVVTIEDDHGQTKGLSAKPHKGDGHYDFSYAFPRAGHYTLRVF